MSFIVDFEPIGRRVPCAPGENLLDAARRAGILLDATCGGAGLCGRCIVRIMKGTASPACASEVELLGQAAVDDGWRLACRVELQGALRVHIPPESLLTAQRIQTEGQSLPVRLDPAVRALTLHLPEPTLESLARAAGFNLEVPKALLPSIPDASAGTPGEVTIFLRGDTLLGVRAKGALPLGLAVDLGTTKLAAFLVDLSSGETLASGGAMNPQIAWGEDVMARLGHAMQVENGAAQLRTAVQQAINDLAHSLCSRAGLSPVDIVDAVIVGNTAMHHLFLGLPVRQLGMAPFAPAVTGTMDVPAAEQGLRFAPGASIHILPNIAGFVGADHVAMLLGSGMLEREGITLGMDIGTNTEISLVAHGKHYSCSTASGPAFEGAHIRFGMRAAPGAIEKVLIHQGEIRLQTIGDQPPQGLCGSGILDLVAQLRRNGIIDSRGAFVALEDPHVVKEKGYAFVVSPGITFDRRDINEIQLAKAAMRTGVNILLERAGVRETDIDTVIVAGAFGTYLDIQSGIDIGMFPRLPHQRFIQVGNAAGAGARMALISLEQRGKAKQIASRVQYVELTGEKDFSARFAKALLLD